MCDQGELEAVRMQLGSYKRELRVSEDIYNTLCNLLERVLAAPQCVCDCKSPQICDCVGDAIRAQLEEFNG